MTLYILKVLITAAVVVAVVEVAKRHSLLGGVLGALPFTSLLAFIWLYLNTGNTVAVARLSIDILWLIVASLPLFLLLPVLLRSGLSFWPSLGTACAVTAVVYVTLFLLMHPVGLRP